MAERKKKEAVSDQQAEGQDLTIEETFDRLEELLKKMEDGDCSLEESFRYYETGMKMVKSCYDKIDMVEKKLVMLDEEGMEE